MEFVFKQRGIPEGIKNHFLNLMESLPPRNKATAIAHEIDQVMKTKAPVCKVVHEISNREEQLTEIEKKVKAQVIDPKSFISLFQEYRNSTIATIEAIREWQERMCTLNSELEDSVPFIYNKVDYLYKLRTDMDFLYRSSL